MSKLMKNNNPWTTSGVKML